MANDVTNKSTSSSVSGTGNVSNHPENNNSGLSNSTSTAADQQKVPPLRIVLNTAGNQKSASTISVDSTQNSTSNRKERHNSSQDTQKSRVRIKLGVNKQQLNNDSISISKERNSNESTSNRSTGTTRGNSNEDNFNDDTSSSSFTHLRRITRRSQRTIQSISNEDEESISSMTSIDENLQQTTSTTTNTDLIAQDSEQSNSALATTTSATSTTASATNGSNSNAAETPRRYKRRKGEPSESQSLDGDAIFGSQNYKLPDQNSIELFKNIRKQVDKRLRNLNSINPKTPYGFKDYMLSRGSYLLDGNKLGNGTNLFMNEDGGLNPPPMGKYHAIRQNRINYTVPNRSKVPLGLPVNSPLYELFIDQERERHKMRMQHIKEREKLTLAAEQEIVRVHNQASLMASNQSEPFSACTMLKHQECYDYLNSDGKIILSRENAHHDQVKPDGVRTRRRQHGQISPPTTTCTNNANPQSRKNSNTDEIVQTPAQEADASCKEDKQLAKTTSNPDAPTSDNTTSSESTKQEGETTQSPTNEVDRQATGDNQSEAKSDEDKQPDDATKDVDSDKDKSQDMCKQDESGLRAEQSVSIESKVKDKNGKSNKETVEHDNTKKTEKSLPVGLNDDTSDKDNGVKEEPMEVDADSSKANTKELNANKAVEEKFDSSEQQIICGEETKSSAYDDLPCAGALSDQNSEESQQDASQQQNDTSSILSSDEDKRAYNKEVFLSQLQEVDDKWDRIRKEMLIRHRNEAESLYAIQKLEWEWKTKEIGLCDVRATPVIDNTLVPKLNIYSQDY